MNWITKIIKAGEKIKTAIHKRASKEEIAKRWNENNASNGAADQIAAKNHRATRNTLLAECDWTQGRDVVLSNDAEWKTYRQALRDLPNHSNFPNLTEEDYPTKPS